MEAKQKVEQEWKKLAESGGITSVYQLTPEVIQKVRERGRHYIVTGWTEIDDTDFLEYKKVIMDYFSKTKMVDAKTVVISKDLYWERKGSFSLSKYLRAIVNGREVWDINVYKIGSEYRIADAGVDETYGKDVFKSIQDIRRELGLD